MNDETSSRERFGRFAEGYVTSASHASGEDLARMVELARPEPGDVALDVATGAGHTALALAPHVARVVAYDLTPEMLAAAGRLAGERGIGNIELVEGAAESLPFPDAAFDIVTCRIAAHHFADVEAFVRESRRVLKPGGRFVVEDHELPMDADAARWIEDFERLRDPSHVRGMSALEWRGLLESRGFLVREVEHYFPAQEVRDWAARQGRSPETTARLEELAATAPALAASWYRIRLRDGAWHFVIPQVLLAAAKA